MKKSELIDALSKIEGDPIIVLSRDAEGNGYEPARFVDTAMYCDGEIGLETLTPDDRDNGYSDEDVMIDGEKAIVIWP